MKALALVLLCACVVTTAEKICEKKDTLRCGKTDYFVGYGSECICYFGEEHYKSVCCSSNYRKFSLSKEDLEPYTSITVVNSSLVELELECSSQQSDLVLKNVQLTSLKISTVQYYCKTMDFSAYNSTLNTGIPFQEVSLAHTDVLHITGLDMHLFVLEKYSRISRLMDVNFSGRSQCFAVRDSEIEYIANANISCSAQIKDSTITDSSHLTFYQSDISNTRFEYVNREIRFKRGKHTLRNVNFGILTRNSLVFDNYAEMFLSNVNITKCLNPCVLIESNSFLIHTENVTIEGNLMKNLRSALYGYTNAFNTYAEDRTTVYGNDSACTVDKAFDTVLCDFYYSEEANDFARYEEHHQTTIQNHRNLAFDEDCYGSLDIINVTGSFQEKYAYDVTNRIDEYCETQTKLTFTNCHFQTISLAAPDSLIIRRSTVDTLNTGPVGQILLDEVRMRSVSNLLTGKKSINIWDRVTVSEVNDLIFESPATWHSVNVTRVVKSFLFRHLGNTTHITASSFHEIAKLGIRLREGTVILSNVSIGRMGKAAIVLRKDGKLILEDIKPGMIHCDSPGSIQVPRRSQVVYKGAVTPQWLRDCTNVTDDTIDVPATDRSLGTRDCKPDRDNTTAICDLRLSKQERRSLGESNALDRYLTVVVKNLESLLIGNHCFDQITLYKIKDVYFESLLDSCYYNLKAKDTTMSRVKSNILDLDITRCIVAMVNPTTTLQHFYAVHSSIDGLTAKVADGEWHNVTVSRIKLLTVTGNVSMYGIEAAEVTVLIVEEGAVLSVVHGEFTHLNMPVTVKGNLHLEHVHIPNCVSKCFKILNGKLSLKNVAFENQTGIFEKEEGSVSYLNVTVNGKLVTIDGTTGNELDQYAKNIFILVGVGVWIRLLLVAGLVACLLNSECCQCCKRCVRRLLQRAGTTELLDDQNPDEEMQLLDMQGDADDDADDDDADDDDADDDPTAEGGPAAEAEVNYV